MLNKVMLIGRLGKDPEFRTTPTGIVLAIIAMTPIVVIPFAYVFEGERPTTQSLLGGLVAIGGVVALVLS